MFIDSLAALEVALCELSSKFGSEQVWWRGHENADWELKPGVFRKRSDGESYKGSTLLAHFKARAPGRLGHRPMPSSETEWLFLAQHYGLPTPLLDWTESPLVALYFVVSAEATAGCDGCLWAASPTILNATHADPANPGRSQKGFVDVDERPVKAIAMLNAGFKQDAVKRLLFPNEHSLPELPSVIALGAVEMDERIVAQSGRFTLFKDDFSLGSLEGSEAYISKFIVPAQEKRKLRNRLQLMGMQRWNLFPDLQSLAEGLKERSFT